MIQLFSIVSQYFQDTVSNSIEPCILCLNFFPARHAHHLYPVLVSEYIYMYLLSVLMGSFRLPHPLTPIMSTQENVFEANFPPSHTYMSAFPQVFEFKFIPVRPGTIVSRFNILFVILCPHQRLRQSESTSLRLSKCLMIRMTRTPTMWSRSRRQPTVLDRNRRLKLANTPERRQNLIPVRRIRQVSTKSFFLVLNRLITLYKVPRTSGRSRTTVIGEEGRVIKKSRA
jgi:hypothetical protein